MAKFFSLPNMYKDFPLAMAEAMEGFVEITGISRLVFEYVDGYEAVESYTDLLEKLATFLPSDIEISEICGFSRNEAENESKLRTRLHIHFNVNSKPYCISIDSGSQLFEEAFLIKLNNILCNFTQPERFLIVLPAGLDNAEGGDYFSYIRPDIHTEIKNHKFQYSTDYGGTGQLDENFPVSDCELPINEHTDTV